MIKGLAHDLVLTGVQAEDDNQGLVGIMLAEHLGDWPMPPWLRPWSPMGMD